MTATIESTRNRDKLLTDLPVSDRRIEISGVRTAVLEGGTGPPILLLHGPGESAFWWMRVIPRLATGHTVFAVDLPGHGETGVGDGTLDEDMVVDWLEELIARTCSSKPVLVGHILGGAIAARFAIRDGEQLRRLVFVDSLGLGKFRPAPGFAFRLFRFLMRPTRKNYDRFLPHCMKDVDDLRAGMGEKWEPFVAYHLARAQDLATKAALRSLMGNVGVPKISDERLAEIDVPVTLIWGREDRANDLTIAEEASSRFGWPLHVIDDARDDPKLERPDAFTRALLESLGSQAGNGRENGREDHLPERGRAVEKHIL